MAVVLLLVGAGAALLVSGVRPVGGQMPMVVDYDVDDNGLIEVGDLAQLNAMRWDLDGDGVTDATSTAADYLLAFPARDTATSTRMGCPMGTCAGYELMADLTFPAETGSPYNPWTPIGAVGNSFITTFDGNGHTLTGLTASGEAPGLFGSVWATGGNIGVIKNLGVIDASVTLTGFGPRGGAIVAYLWGGARVDASYALGGSVNLASNGVAGGLAGANVGLIRASYATAAVGSVTPRSQSELGGLVGNLFGGTIIASYAAGPVSVAPGGGDNGVGGLVGRSRTPDSVITDSYCDTEATGQSACVGRQLTHSGGLPGATSTLVTAPGKTTAELQSPTGYTGIYRDWNLDLSRPADSVADDPWRFGGRGDYPTLWHQTPPDSPPPGGPRVALPPEDTPYDPAADHPEVYVNERWEMAVDCDVQKNADGEPESSQITFDLGNYQGVVILHLAIWNGEFFMSYES